MRNKSCVICKKEISSKLLCEEHKKQLIIIKKNMKNLKTEEIISYYHNLKHSIYKMINLNYIKDNILKLMAISIVYFERTNNKKLIEKCVFDVQKILKIKIQYDDKNQSMLEKIKNGDFDEIDFRKRWESQYRCADGHYVRSIAEMLIDNELYSNGIRHSYEKRVRIEKYPNSILISDFYLPEIDTYIEYWGKYDKKYIDRKYAKRKIYHENKINIIELYYDDLKRLDDILINKIDEIKNSYKKKSS